MEMQDVFKAIATEREYQDRKWGNIFINLHSVAEWLLILDLYMRKAKDAYRIVNGPEANSDKVGDAGAMNGIRKIIAIGVACAEQHGLSMRELKTPAKFALTARELALCSQHPDVLLALANHHSVSETEADACDMPDSAEFHRQRKDELRAEAARIAALGEA